MARPHFCGVHAGPRTVFHISVLEAYSIEGFSVFQGDKSEHEVLFRPLARFQVRSASRNILNPDVVCPRVSDPQAPCKCAEELVIKGKSKSMLEWSGTGADVVNLTQVLD